MLYHSYAKNKQRASGNASGLIRCSRSMTPALDLPSLLAARYGQDGPLVSFDAFADDAFLKTLLAHKSVRRYQSQPLTPGTLELLSAAAQSAASSSNLQVWSVIALRDPTRKADAAALCGDQDFIRQAPLFLIFCADLARLTAASEREGLPGAGLDYLEMFLTSVVDASLAAQNAAIAAESLGLGICYVGAARNHPRELAALLNLPPRVIALFGLTVGIPAEDDTSAIKPRLPQPGLLHHETYDSVERDRAVAAYDETMRGFYDAQHMGIQDSWAQHSAKRVAGPEALSGREIWREVLLERGFELK
jgi:nitroreductase